jgi:hypothetical protein
MWFTFKFDRRKQKKITDFRKHHEAFISEFITLSLLSSRLSSIYTQSFIYLLHSTIDMSSGSSRGKGVGNDRRKDGGKLPPICFDGPLGPDYFEEAVFNFPVQSKRDFNKEVRLRSYDNKREDWPKCMHGEDCLVQMFVEGGLMEVGVSSDVFMHM